MIDERMDFTGRTAVITGAASGMGELAAKEIARRGGAVVMADINGARAEEIAQEIRAAGGRAATPEEMVQLVLYLASDNAAFITGTTYLADGGRTCIH